MSNSFGIFEDVLEKGQKLFSQMHITKGSSSNNDNNLSTPPPVLKVDSLTGLEMDMIEDEDNNDDDDNNNNNNNNDKDEDLEEEEGEGEMEQASKTYNQKMKPITKKSSSMSSTDSIKKNGGVRKLGKEFQPETDSLELQFGRKPGIIPKMWDDQEDELLRKAVAKYGEKDFKKVATMVPGRTHLQCLQRWSKALRPGLVKGHWTAAEDQRLLTLMKVHGHNWHEISQNIPGRNPKQCRERWALNLDPSINRGEWTPEEDARLIALQKEHGGRWSVIAKNMPGRTENMVKSRAHTLIRLSAREKDFNRWENRVIVEFCLSNGRQWSHLLKLLPGRTKGQVKKQYISLMREHQELVKLVELAESNINRGIVNEGAHERALLMIPIGSPEEETPTKAIEDSSSALSSKTKSFHVLKPATTNAVALSNRRRMQKEAAFGSEIMKGGNGMMPSIDTKLDGFSDEFIPNLSFLENFSSSSFSVGSGGGSSSFNQKKSFGGGGLDEQERMISQPDFRVQNPQLITLSPTNSGLYDDDRKKLVHHKGSSWLDDVEEFKSYEPKLKRTGSMDMLEKYILSKNNSEETSGITESPNGLQGYPPTNTLFPNVSPGNTPRGGKVQTPRDMILDPFYFDPSTTASTLSSSSSTIATMNNNNNNNNNGRSSSSSHVLPKKTSSGSYLEHVLNTSSDSIGPGFDLDHLLQSSNASSSNNLLDTSHKLQANSSSNSSSGWPISGRLGTFHTSTSSEGGPILGGITDDIFSGL